MDLVAAARQWQTDGWALVDGLIDVATIDAVAGELEHLFSADTFDDYNRAAGAGDGRRRGRRSVRRSSRACGGSRSAGARA